MMNDYEKHLPEWISEFEPFQFISGSKITDTGVSVAVVSESGLLFKGAYGYQDRDQKNPVTVDTVFPIASITKSFTATVLTVLLDKRKMTPYKRVIELIPELRFQVDRITEESTFTDFLSHRTGFPRHDNMWARCEYEQDEILRRLKDLQLLKVSDFLTKSE